jgi:hypothetical protein
MQIAGFSFKSLGVDGQITVALCRNNPADTIPCECEMVPQATVDEIVRCAPGAVVHTTGYLDLLGCHSAAEGNLLAYQDWICQRCGAGVAIATTYMRVKSAAVYVGVDRPAAARV